MGEGQEQMLPDLKKQFGEGWWKRSNRRRGGEGEQEEEQRYSGDWRLCLGEAIKGDLVRWLSQHLPCYKTLFSLLLAQGPLYSAQIRSEVARPGGLSRNL